MDDLLIVKMSERSKERFARRRPHSPEGASFGLIAGAGLGLALASAWENHPYIGLAIGLAIGMALGGLFGRFLKPRRRKPFDYGYRYEGMPISENEDSDDKATE